MPRRQVSDLSRLLPWQSQFWLSAGSLIGECAMSFAQGPAALLFFFFNYTPTTEIYTLSLHDALPILEHASQIRRAEIAEQRVELMEQAQQDQLDRKSTRLNSSHGSISYAVFCLKKQRRALPATLHQAHLLLYRA